jgi:Ca2+-binding RTX toxin-like protein
MKSKSWHKPMHSQPRPVPARLRRRLLVEPLENRTLPSVDFLALGTGLNTRLNTLKADVQTIDSVNALPVVGQPLSAAPGATGIVGSFQTKLINAIKGPGDAQQNIFDTLGPNGKGLNILGDTDSVPGITKADVGFVLSNGNNDVTITLHLLKDPQTGPADQTNFGIGLPGVPLFFGNKGDAVVHTGYEFKSLVFGVHNSNQFFFNQSLGGLTISVAASIPNATANQPMLGMLGFLPIQAFDADPVNTPTQFTGAFVMDITQLAHLNNPSLTGQADIHLKLATEADVMIPGDTSLPGITSDFNMNWGFNQTNPQGGLATFGGVPSVAFNNIQLNVGSTLSDLVKPWLDKLDKILEPIKPTIDVLTQPVPVINESLRDLLANNGIVPQGMIDLIDLATNVVQIASNEKDVAAAISTVNIDFGSLDLGAANGDLRQVPKAADYANLGQSLTKLVATGITSVTFQDLENQVLAGFDPNDPIRAAVQGVFDFFDPAQNPHIHFDFPLLSNPSTGIAQLLLGQDVSLVHFRADYQNEQASFGGNLPFPFVPVAVDIAFGGTVTMDAALGIGYDTKGIREFAKAFLLNPNMVPVTDLKDGLFLDGDTHASVLGNLDGILVAIGPLASAVISGGLDANFNLALDNPQKDPKLYLFQNPNPCLFDASGAVSFEVSGVVGILVLPLPGLIVYPFDVGPETLLSLSDCIANPFEVPPTFRLAGPAIPVPGQTNEFIAADPGGTLTLNMGPHAMDRISFDTTDGAEVFSIALDARRDTDPPTGEALLVTSFGVTQRYAGVQHIVADGGLDDDVIQIGKGITSDVVLHGGAGNDKLSYRGQGGAQLYGDDGVDTLAGGAGQNLLDGGVGDDHLTGGAGPNQMSGGPGNDVLVGGDGLNQMNGGDGNDQLFAGPQNDLLDGGTGNDVLAAGAGAAQLFGGAGMDTFVWKAGNGSVNIDGQADDDTVNLFGSDADDVFNFIKVGFSVQVAAPAAILTIQAVERINVDGGLGSDTITVNDLVGTGLREVNVNVNDFATPDHAVDHVTVNGAPKDDTFKIFLQSIMIGREQGVGGVTDIRRGDFLVRTANVNDDVQVNGLDGDDTFDIFSITGPTTVNGNDGADEFDVFVAAADYFGPLTLDGNAGVNKLKVDESANAGGDVVTLTSSSVVGNLLANGITYVSTGGNFEGGVSLTGTLVGDTINVQSTLPNVTTLVSGNAGNDLITVCSTAPLLGGDLGSIEGTLAVDAGTGANTLVLSDRGAPTGNQDVQVGPSTIAGFAGPSDGTFVSYTAMGGSLRLALQGSDTEGETFGVNQPNARFDLFANGGDDTVNVLSLSKPALIDTGAGFDTVNVGSTTTSLDQINAFLGVLGQGEAFLNIFDVAAGAGHFYTLTANSFARAGVGPIAFDSTTKELNIAVSNFDDVVAVQGLPAATQINLSAGGGNNTVQGPPLVNTWHITSQNAGDLNGVLQFNDVQNLTGGPLSDRFVFANGVGLDGIVLGQSGFDTLDYSTYSTPVAFDPAAGAATNLGGFGGIEWVIGGQDRDRLFGSSSPNLWQIKGVDAGNLLTVLFTLQFASIETLIGGPNTDTFLFSDGAGEHGDISGGAGTDKLDYSAYTAPVIVNLANHKATGVGGQVLLIENVTGGSGDDQITGDTGDNILRGGPGNDVIHGGGGNDIFLGEAGDDRLIGGSGRDLLIGGKGADRIAGGDGEDILINGTTLHDANDQALLGIMAEWTSALSYTMRINHLRNGGGQNGNVELNSNTVMDDAFVDVLLGGNGQDWLWASIVAPKDVKDQQPGEIVN